MFFGNLNQGELLTGTLCFSTLSDTTAVAVCNNMDVFASTMSEIDRSDSLSAAELS